MTLVSPQQYDKHPYSRGMLGSRRDPLKTWIHTSLGESAGSGSKKRMRISFLAVSRGLYQLQSLGISGEASAAFCLLTFRGRGALCKMGCHGPCIMLKNWGIRSRSARMINVQISGNAITVRSHLLRPSRSIGMSHVLVTHLPQPQSWLTASN